MPVDRLQHPQPVDRRTRNLKARIMTMENTDLERRVLAHERILQILIAHMTEAEPKFLERLQEKFSKPHGIGDNEHDFIDTDQYAREFIREVMNIGGKGA